MNAAQIGAKLKSMASEGQGLAFIEAHYADNVVSIEAQDFAGMSARMEGKEAITGKNVWWEENHEVHGLEILGPFVGHRADQFALIFNIDATPKGGERSPMSEVALYTIDGDKIIQEEFMYSVP